MRALGLLIFVVSVPCPACVRVTKDFLVEGPADDEAGGPGNRTCPDDCESCEIAPESCDPGGCKPGLGLTASGQCDNCTDHCAVCNQTGAGACDLGGCAYGYGPNSDGGCEKCPENCFYCNEGHGKCDLGQCYFGYGPNSDGGCEKCHEGCFRCKDGPEKCELGECYHGYGRNADGGCKKCPENCFQCKDGPEKCDAGECWGGYDQDPSTGLCTKQCDYKFGRKSPSDECKPCPENCFFCNGGPDKCDPGQCYLGHDQNPSTGLCEKPCDYRFGRNSSFQCEPCPERCFYCKGGSSSCDPGQCYMGTTRDPITGLCSCYQSQVEHPVTGACVDACGYGYGRNSTFGCEPCPEKCSACSDDGSHKCDIGKCDYGYFRNTSGLCQQRTDQ